MERNCPRGSLDGIGTTLITELAVREGDAYLSVLLLPRGILLLHFLTCQQGLCHVVLHHFCHAPNRRRELTCAHVSVMNGCVLLFMKISVAARNPLSHHATRKWKQAPIYGYHAVAILILRVILRGNSLQKLLKMYTFMQLNILWNIYVLYIYIKYSMEYIYIYILADLMRSNHS
jgi:hypothetical protein